jgi:glycosyltransferase involved in cell wall biosynthesis
MKVSICLPTYRQKIYLEKNLQSILAQSFTDFELIITDDTPDNEIFCLVEDFKPRFDGKLKYYKNPVSLGSPENWNESIRYATGEYIKIMHHDDWFTDSDSLLHFVKMLDDNPRADFAFSAAVAISIKHDRTWIHCPSPEQIAQLRKDPLILFFGNFVGPPSSTIYRRKNSHSYDRNLKWVVDFEFYIRCLMRNSDFVFNDKPLITSISGASHSVTNDCEDNKNVEISEYVYLFDKLSGRELKLWPTSRFIDFFRNLFHKYEIISVRDIRACGYHGSIPFSLTLLVYFTKLQKYLPVRYFT